MAERWDKRLCFKCGKDIPWGSTYCLWDAGVDKVPVHPLCFLQLREKSEKEATK